MLGEPDVESLDVVGFAGLSLLFELVKLFIQGLQLILHRGRALVTMEFAHSQDVVLKRRRFGIAHIIFVFASLGMSEKASGLLPAAVMW